MTRTHLRLLSLPLGFVLMALALAVIATPATASSGGAEVTRVIVVDDLEVEHTTKNCSGVEGTFSRTFHGFIQTTTRPDGTTLFRGWLRADEATFVPDVPRSRPSRGREDVHVSMVEQQRCCDGQLRPPLLGERCGRLGGGIQGGRAPHDQRRR